MYILCTEEDKAFLGRNYDIKFLEGQNKNLTCDGFLSLILLSELSSQEKSDGNVTVQRPTTAVLRVCDRPGALYEVLRTLGVSRSDIRIAYVIHYSFFRNVILTFLVLIHVVIVKALQTTKITM